MRLTDVDKILEFFNKTSEIDCLIDKCVREVFDTPDCDEIYVSGKYKDHLNDMGWLLIYEIIDFITQQIIETEE